MIRSFEVVYYWISWTSSSGPTLSREGVGRQHLLDAGQTR